MTKFIWKAPDHVIAIHRDSLETTFVEAKVQADNSLQILDVYILPAGTECELARSPSVNECEPETYGLENMATPAGLEPATTRLEGEVYRAKSPAKSVRVHTGQVRRFPLKQLGV